MLAPKYAVRSKFVLIVVVSLVLSTWEAFAANKSYPLTVDPSKFEVWNFVRTGDRWSVFSFYRQNGDAVIDDFVHRKIINKSSPLFSEYNSGLPGWTTWSASDDVHSLKFGQYNITFHPDDGQSMDKYPGIFSDACPNPFGSYISLEKNGITKDLVVIYMFGKAKHVIYNQICQDSLFYDSSGFMKVIAPILVAKISDDGSLLLAGRSYVSMPVVMSISPDSDTIGDGRSIFTIEKYIIDKLISAAYEKYQASLKTEVGRYIPVGRFLENIQSNVEQYLKREHSK